MKRSFRVRRRRISHRLCKVLSLISKGAIALFIGILTYLYWPRSLPPQPSSFTLIAHRGVSQTFPLDNLQNDTCTAEIIYPPRHKFLENTIPSIRAAFQYGADIVEIDIHPTTDNQLAVFHDWTLDCRTNGRGITHEQSIETLKKLDIGYGYTADGGKTYPFRGQGIGALPSFDEVMQEFPNHKFLIDQKDSLEKTVKLLATSLQKYPAQQRENIYFFSSEKRYKQLKQDVPEVQKLFPNRKEAKDCVPQYLMMLFSGRVSNSCNRYAFGIPVRYLKYVPGWPHLFLSKAHEANLKTYVIEVETLEALDKIRELPLDGIVTNRVEIIGPSLSS